MRVRREEGASAGRRRMVGHDSCRDLHGVRVARQVSTVHRLVDLHSLCITRVLALHEAALPLWVCAAQR